MSTNFRSIKTLDAFFISTSPHFHNLEQQQTSTSLTTNNIMKATSFLFTCLLFPALSSGQGNALRGGNLQSIRKTQGVGQLAPATLQGVAEVVTVPETLPADADISTAAAEVIIEIDENGVITYTI